MMSLINPLAEYDHSDDPLPLLVAREWRFPLQVHVHKRAYFYAVQDWIAGLASVDAAKASKIWFDIKNQTSDSIGSLKSDGQTSSSNGQLNTITELPYLAADGKTYQRDFAADRDLYFIAQHMRTTKTRPALAAIKDFLARAGAFADFARRDPAALLDAATAAYQKQGKGQNWIDNRLQGMASRKAFTAALKSAIGEAVSDGNIYQTSTNALYVGLWERTAAQLKADLDLKPSDRVRDHFGEYALMYTGLAESLIARRLQNMEAVPFELAQRLVREIAALIHQQASQTARLLGIDLVTEKPLLKPSNR